MEYAISLFVVIIEFFIIKNFSDCILKHIKTKHLIMLGFIYIISSFILVNFPLENSNYIKNIIMIVFLFTFISLCYRSNIYLKIFTTIVTYLSLYSFDYVFILILTSKHDNLMSLLNNPLIYIIVTFSSKFSLYVISFFIKHFFKDNEINKNFNIRYFIYSSIFPIFSLITLVILFEITVLSGLSSYWIALDVVGIICANLVIISILEMIEKSETLKQEKIILEQNLKSELANIKNISELYSQQRKLTHDFNNHLLTINSLAENYSDTTIFQYTNQLLNELIDNSIIIDTNNTTVNAIINQKYHQAQLLHINIKFDINDLESIPISNNDIVVILANALDNAIAAAANTPNKQIIVKILYEVDSLLISIMNTSPKVDISNIFNAKSNISHGFGLKNIKQVLSKYNHIFAIDYDNGWFQLSIIINS